jgi:integrase
LTFSKILSKNVLQNVLPVGNKKDYSIGFYTGGLDHANWHTYTPAEQKKALSKYWYIRYSYRNPATGVLVKQPHIKQGLNRYKTFSERMEFLKAFRKGMVSAFDKGITPYTINTVDEPKKDTQSIGEAINYALQIKTGTVAERTANEYALRCGAFKKWLKSRGLINKDVRAIDRKIVSDYLDHVLLKTSARTRNNVRADLSAIFTVLANKFIIDSNFIKNDLPKLRTKSKTDRRFTTEQMISISAHLKKSDPYLLLFIKIVAYNFLRPVEVCRLTVGDVDVINRELYFNQKTKLGKTKYIPNIYFNELKELVAGRNPKETIFAPGGEPKVWTVSDKQKQNYFGKQFKKVKDQLNIPDGFSFYSFRHSFITGTYIVLRKKKNLGHMEALDYLMKITGHNSKEGIMKYIHANDADRPDDWSNLIDLHL